MSFSPFDKVDPRDRPFSLNLIFSQNTHPKNMKLPPIDHKSSILPLEAFESELDKIMILSLKYNKSFFKLKSLVTPQMYYNHQNQFMEQHLRYLGYSQ